MVFGYLYYAYLICLWGALYCDSCIEEAMKVNECGLSLIDTLLSEYEPHESRTTVEKYLTLKLRRKITNNMYSALVPLGMAIGTDMLETSGIIKLINLGKPHEAAHRFDFFIYHDDENYGFRVADPFLVRQREMEKALYFMPEIVTTRKKAKNE
jgi:GH24 family phage-related lysozyme (muramidase)